MIGSAPKPARREEESRSSAIILPFRLRASRMEVAKAGKVAPAVEIESKTGASKKLKSKTAAVATAERLTILPSRYRGWLQQALIAAVLLHLVVFAMLHFQFVRDVERAANAGGAASDGTTVLDIEIVAEAKLPPSKTPTNMTAPDATKQTNTPPQIKQQEKQKETQKTETAPNNASQFALPKEELAPASKAETSNAPQSLNQKRDDPADVQRKVEQQKTRELKKKQEQTPPSNAAAPARAGGNRTPQSQTGANGTSQQNGQANSPSYNAMVIAHLQRFRAYPEQARAAKITGVSTVRFTLGAGGNVISVSLAGSSGAGVLDQAAIAMVQRASPFPPIPPSLGRGSMTFAAPVRFNLR